MRVSTKGQVTIPHEIRDRLGLQPGTELACEVDGDRITLTKTQNSRRGEKVVARLRGSGHGSMSTDEIMALTRQ